MQILDAANLDNELGNIYRDDHEYVIEINWWNHVTYSFRTIGCKYISHRIEWVDDIGDITFNNNRYRFLTPDGTGIILEIEAEQIVPMA